MITATGRSNIRSAHQDGKGWVRKRREKCTRAHIRKRVTTRQAHTRNQITIQQQRVVKSTNKAAMMTKKVAKSIITIGTTSLGPLTKIAFEVLGTSITIRLSRITKQIGTDIVKITTNTETAEAITAVTVGIATSPAKSKVTRAIGPNNKARPTKRIRLKHSRPRMTSIEARTRIKGLNTRWVKYQR